MGSGTFEVTDANFQAEVLESSTPVLVDFWAEWCGPCRMVAPIVDQMAEAYAGQLKVGKLDADLNPDTMMAYGVLGIPTLILFKDGEEIERVTGFAPGNVIPNIFAAHLGTASEEAEAAQAVHAVPEAAADAGAVIPQDDIPVVQDENENVEA